MHGSTIVFTIHSSITGVVFSNSLFVDFIYGMLVREA